MIEDSTSKSEFMGVFKLAFDMRSSSGYRIANFSGSEDTFDKIHILLEPAIFIQKVFRLPEARGTATFIRPPKSKYRILVFGIYQARRVLQG